MPYSEVDQAMRTAAKPRIRYIRKYGIYRCTGQTIETVGISPAQAYSAWETCNEAREEISRLKGRSLVMPTWEQFREGSQARALSQGSFALFRATRFQGLGRINP